MSEVDWTREQAMIQPRMQVLQRAAAALEQGRWSSFLARSGVFEAEKLRQYLDQRGHTRAVQLLTELLPLLESGSYEGVGERVSELQRVLAQPPPAEPERSPPVTILVVDTDSASRQALADEIVARGLHPLLAADASAATSLLAPRPDLAIVDPSGFPWPDVQAFFQQLKAVIPAVPSLILTAASDQAARVAAQELDASLFVARPQEPAEVLNLVEDLLGWTAFGSHSVLIVDDDPVSLEALAEVFAAYNVPCTTLSSVALFWETLEETRPGLLVLDLDMPGLDGSQLCRLVRADPQWRGLPIVFLTGVRDVHALEAVYEAGADDLITKPIAVESFMLRIANRVERQRALLRFAQYDPVTGALSRRQAAPRIIRWLGQEGGVSLAVVSIDLLADLNVALGFEAGDAILRRTARLLAGHLPPRGVLARWAGDQFVVACPGQTRESLARILESTQGELHEEPMATVEGRPVHTSFSAGVVQSPDDGTTVIDLYRTALTLTRQVRRQGRGQVLTSAWFGSEAFAGAPLDILVVMADEALAHQLLTALSVRGVRGSWVAGGQNLLSRLLSAASGNPHLVVLLDVGPETSGMRHLFHQDATLAAVRVVDCPAEVDFLSFLAALEQALSVG